jgi:hypothetical protein
MWGEQLVACVEVFDAYVGLQTDRVDRQQHDVTTASVDQIGDRLDLRRERAMDEAFVLERLP